MLVLSRHRDEAVILRVGDVEIRVLCVDLRGDKVRLGFDAPQEVVIHREEVWTAIQRDGSRKKS